MRSVCMATYNGEKYIREHPKASIQEVAIESGFSSRQTYYSVKAKLRGGDQ